MRKELNLARFARFYGLSEVLDGQSEGNLLELVRELAAFSIGLGRGIALAELADLGSAGTAAADFTMAGGCAHKGQ